MNKLITEKKYKKSVEINIDYKYRIEEDIRDFEKDIKSIKQLIKIAKDCLKEEERCKCKIENPTFEHKGYNARVVCLNCEKPISEWTTDEAVKEALEE